MTIQWLHRALEESRARGFLGPAEISTQIEHATGFSRVWADVFPAPPSEFLDLGSGGGLPGLVLLETWGCSATFVDSMVKRTNFLEEALRWEGAPSSANVINGRVEVLARLPELEEGFALVTARSFGPPAVTAECAARLLRLEGLLIVSEPPDDEQRSRWDSPGLAKLGLRSEGRVRHGAAFQVIRKIKATPRMFPREVGVPGKNPLF